MRSSFHSPRERKKSSAMPSEWKHCSFLRGCRARRQGAGPTAHVPEAFAKGGICQTSLSPPPQPLITQPGFHQLHGAPAYRAACGGWEETVEEGYSALPVFDFCTLAQNSEKMRVMGSPCRQYTRTAPKEAARWPWEGAHLGPDMSDQSCCAYRVRHDGASVTHKSSTKKLIWQPAEASKPSGT